MFFSEVKPPFSKISQYYFWVTGFTLGMCLKLSLPLSPTLHHACQVRTGGVMADMRQLSISGNFFL